MCRLESPAMPLARGSSTRTTSAAGFCSSLHPVRTSPVCPEVIAFSARSRTDTREGAVLSSVPRATAPRHMGVDAAQACGLWQLSIPPFADVDRSVSKSRRPERGSRTSPTAASYLARGQRFHQTLGCHMSNFAKFDVKLLPTGFDATKPWVRMMRVLCSRTTAHLLCVAV
jgi:hypothetical protein